MRLLTSSKREAKKNDGGTPLRRVGLDDSTTRIRNKLAQKNSCGVPVNYKCFFLRLPRSYDWPPNRYKETRTHVLLLSARSQKRGGCIRKEGKATKRGGGGERLEKRGGHRVVAGCHEKWTLSWRAKGDYDPLLENEKIGGRDGTMLIWQQLPHRATGGGGDRRRPKRRRRFQIHVCKKNGMANLVKRKMSRSQDTLRCQIYRVPTEKRRQHAGSNVPGGREKKRKGVPSCEKSNTNNKYQIHTTTHTKTNRTCLSDLSEKIKPAGEAEKRRSARPRVEVKSSPRTQAIRKIARGSKEDSMYGTASKVDVADGCA